MAIASSSSSSSIVAPQKYGVFLSFRGSDTRNTFVGHLYEALLQQGIPTFIDSEEFQKGREISKILDEIRKSNVSVVILSTNYADSPWCLDELVKIMECRKTQAQQVLPVFYHVDPSHVENRTGSYGVAFEKHQADKKNTAETLQCWRNALIQVANLSGRVVIDDSSEAEAIKDIVKDISNILQPLYPNDFQDLVGILQRIQQVESLLCIGRSDIRVIGIRGMGGLGKTTLANALFNKYNSYFDGSCFLKHVRERSKSGGLNQLQQDLVFEIFHGKKYNSTDKMLSQLRHKKVLIVLDDIDSCQQFDEIIVDWKRYGPGSRIIITSRDKQVLRNVGRQDWIYEIPALEEKESLQLFMLHALKEDKQQQWHSELSKEFVNYVKGNPLGLKTLGQHLQGKDEQEWQSALCKIKKGLHKTLTEALKISFDGLDFHEKQIFLDIACFFNRNPTFEVRRILHAYYGSSVEDGLRNLEDKSLVGMSSPYVDMHDLLEEMGKEVVREESRKEPGKRSRLWDHEDINQVLTNDTGSEAVEGILMVNYGERLEVAPTVFTKMAKLKLLKFMRSSYVVLAKGIKFLPKDELRQFEWPFYPLRSLPSDFIPKKLVTLDMSFSAVEQLWNGVGKFPNLHKIIMMGSRIERLWIGAQDMPNLKMMNLSWCKHMIEMPDLSKAPKLEELYCVGCENLKEVSPSISHLSNLQKLDFRNCVKIRSFPCTVSAMCLKELHLRGCSNLRMFPEVSRNIERLDLYGAGIREIPLEVFRGLSSLEQLNLGRNEMVRSLPDSLGCLSSLQVLDVSGSSIHSVPTSIIQLSRLLKLSIANCERLRCLPELPSSVCVLRAEGCNSLRNVSFISRLTPCEVSERVKFDGCVLDFCLADCINLDENSRENIFAFAQQSITTVVAPTVNKLIEEGITINNPQSLEFAPGDIQPSRHIVDEESLVRASYQLTGNFFRKLLDFKLVSSFMREKVRVPMYTYAEQSGTIKPNELVEKDPNDYWLMYSLVCRFVVPGNEMPDWIEHRSGGGGGSSITIDFQPLNLLGFIFCVVTDLSFFDRGYHLPAQEFDIQLKVQLNSNNCGSRRDSISRNWQFFHKSQHVFLGYAPYFPNEAYSQFSELAFTMESTFMKQDSSAGAVLKWGLSLIYKDADDEKEYRNDEVKEQKDPWEENADDEEEHRARRNGESDGLEARLSDWQPEGEDVAVEAFGEEGEESAEDAGFEDAGIFSFVLSH